MMAVSRCRRKHWQTLMQADYETYDLDYVLTLAKRFYAKGYRIYLDYRKLSGVVVEMHAD